MENWIHLVFSHPATLTDAMIIIGKTTIIYAFLVLGLRFLGKRELAQMTSYDIVLMVVLANAVQNAMIGEDTTLFGGLISATTLLILNRAIFMILRRYKPVEEFLTGHPVILVRHGVLQKSAMDREGITREQVEAGLREHGIEHVKDADLAILECDGAISVIPSGVSLHRTKRHYRGVRLT